ncbi:putative methyltransferase C9orf114 isoform X2 [Phalaenopsis equestris]|uniref:putative methyltransferase C9orf114 isoform X2 n=1 Tax=Phalaenopsis equestris TaxID=78828 RepID=UPI0009E27E6F|nr:putative methyltransferase C9orf114 isoform X2 [Phalaenopsis equestris]
MVEYEAENIKKKKRKEKNWIEDTIRNSNNFLEGNHKENNKKKSKKEEHKWKEIPTVSIAVIGSIIDNTQSQELATLLAGQIARAATIFHVDEIVVVDSKSMVNNSDENETGAQFLVRILQYLETPQYLRRRLFPMHNSLKHVGLLPPLDAPHHVRKHEWSPFREGVTLEVNSSGPGGTLVDVGLRKNVKLEQVLKPGLRVTVAMGADRNFETDSLKKVVGENTPREEMGIYWGYKVRYAPNFSSVFKNCLHKESYDYIVGTSEHGAVIKSSELSLPNFQHLLIAFGGLGGLEESIEEDNNLKGKSVNEVFHSYLNTCPHQGSRTIRTEEAIFISLQYFQEPIIRAGRIFEASRHTS